MAQLHLEKISEARKPVVPMSPHRPVMARRRVGLRARRPPSSAQGASPRRRIYDWARCGGGSVNAATCDTESAGDGRPGPFRGYSSTSRRARADHFAVEREEDGVVAKVGGTTVASTVYRIIAPTASA